MPPVHTTEKATYGVDDHKLSNGGFCFWMPCRYVVRSIWWQRTAAGDKISAADLSSTTHKESWWSRGWKKVREWSESVVAPKWKTFIRRFNKNKNDNGDRGVKFHYDPFYFLNFDEGSGRNDHFDEDRNFSSRYASLSLSAKSSMDFGEDRPCFT